MPTTRRLLYPSLGASWWTSGSIDQESISQGGNRVDGDDEKSGEEVRNPNGIDDVHSRCNGCHLQWLVKRLETYALDTGQLKVRSPFVADIDHGIHHHHSTDAGLGRQGSELGRSAIWRRVPRQDNRLKCRRYSYIVEQPLYLRWGPGTWKYGRLINYLRSTTNY